LNDPPTSTDLEYHIREDEILDIYYTDLLTGLDIAKIPASDVDNSDDEVAAVLYEITADSVGTWKDSAGTVLDFANVPLTGFELIDRRLQYTPPPNTYSIPENQALATLTFKVHDLEPLFSPTYTIRIFVEPVPDLPVFVEAEITGDEDTQILIPLDNRDVTWSSPDIGIGEFTIVSLGKGTFGTCDLTACTDLTPADLPFTLVDGRLYYRPLPDEFGDNYSSFTFTLEVKDPSRPNAPTMPLTVNYVINIRPVNDPPILIPHWAPEGAPIGNECDEDTWARVNFTATDIDSPASVLRAETLLLLDHFQSDLYTCAGAKQENCAKPKKNLIKTIGPFEKISDAFWEVSFVPFPNWNGKLKMEFVVWDEFLPSQPETCLVRVWPINDPPTIVKGATTITGEYYEKNGEQWVPVQDATSDKTKFNIYDEKSADQRELNGVPLIESDPGSAVSKDEDKEKKKNEGENVIRIDRLRTEVQDIDFFFQYHLILNATLIHAVWVPALMPPAHPCWFQDGPDHAPLQVNCDDEIRALNVFLLVGGFPILLDEDASSGLGIFLLNDTGSIDKWDRPLASGFTIEFFPPEEVEVLVTPIAALVILPVIAAVSAAAIAAGWFLLGNRAQQYAGAGFEAMMVSNASGGNASPLYDAKGLEVTSALYQGGH